MKKYRVYITCEYFVEATNPKEAIDRAIGEDIESPDRAYSVFEQKGDMENGIADDEELVYEE